MSVLYRYAAYVVNEGRPGNPILSKKMLKDALKTGPHTIYIKAHEDNYVVDEPYEGLLSNAPHEIKFIIEGRKKAKPPSRQALMLGMVDYGRVEVTFQVYMEWSESATRWRIVM